MAHPVLMPKAGQSMTEGRIVAWLKKEGDPVAKGEPLMEIETDKANLEVEAVEGGVLRRIFVPEGEICAVLTPVGVIGESEEEIDFEEVRAAALEAAGESSGAGDDAGASRAALAAPAAPASAPAPSASAESAAHPTHPAAPPAARPPAPASPPLSAIAPATAPAPLPVGGAVSLATPAPLAPPTDARGRRLRASPLARRRARERGVELSLLRGSGPGGRILRRDVEAAPAGASGTGESGNGFQPLRSLRAPYPAPSPRPPSEVRLEGMRGAIASALQQSKQTIPHFYAALPIDMTSALAVKAARAAAGVKITVNDLILRAVVLALKDEPRVNCRVGADRVQYPDEINLGIAVGSDEGLVVPVVQRAGELDLAGLASRSRHVVEAAQKGKLIGMGQGTFTVSNLGMFGLESFSAIINPPEGAILAVGGMQEEAVAHSGGLFARPRLRVTLSCDHRAIDGLLAARFLARLRYFLETGSLD